MSRDLVDTKAFYSEYHGHKVDHLQKLLPHLRQTSTNLIWTAGDSSLDNKYWFHTKSNAINGYENILRPQQSICDVTYWLNYQANERFNDGTSKSNLAAINTAGKNFMRLFRLCIIQKEKSLIPITYRLSLSL